MGLTRAESAIIEKARVAGGAALGAHLDDESCACLVAIIGADLRLPLAVAAGAPRFFETQPAALRLDGVPFWPLIEQAVALNREVVTYFACLAKLHKARLKYASVLRTQAIPTMDQVGPRGLLQFGTMSPRALTALLLWRKWIFDIDNRAAQETGYLFEPIIAHSIGGVPASGKKSPIHRHNDKTKGRQVDCITKKRAYEFKLRVTIAASGQGRWKEELDFPLDCKASGYTPVLVVFDPTPNEKLGELQRAFLKSGGEAHVGPAAWRHLDELAGSTMSVFINKYVRDPINALLGEMPPSELPEMKLSMIGATIRFSISGEEIIIERALVGAEGDTAADREIPEDVDDESAGP